MERKRLLIKGNTFTYLKSRKLEQGSITQKHFSSLYSPISCSLKKYFQTFELLLLPLYQHLLSVLFICFSKFEYLSLSYFFIDFLCHLVTLCYCKVLSAIWFFFPFCSYTLDYILHWFLSDNSSRNEPKFRGVGAGPGLPLRLSYIFSV